MMRWTRLPLRLRLSSVFAAGMALVLAGVGLFVYARAGRDLLATVDAGLRSRAEVVSTDIREHGPALANVGAGLIERDEAFVQVVASSGALEQSSSIVASRPMLPPTVTAGVSSPTLFTQKVAGIDNLTRILAVPVDASGGRVVLLVGSSLQDRRDAMLGLAYALAIGGVAALAIVCVAGWLLAGAALRPVDRMRREAANISSSDLERRLSLPPSEDEITELGRTLNSMLDRLGASFLRERRLLDNASHELRTPLAILKAELDLATARERPRGELLDALRSAQEETEHLVRLAEDLLVISRAQEGDLPLRLEDVDLHSVVASAVEHNEPRATQSGIELTAETFISTVRADPVRLRQAIDDLLDNAIRHTPRGGHIAVSGAQVGGHVRIDVADTGLGFAPETLSSVFEPFARGADADTSGGAGLGLAIVRAIVQAHGGHVEAANGEVGATVTMVLPVTPAPRPL